MPGGIAVEVAVERPGDCPVASASEEAEGSITEVSRGSVPAESGTVTEEFAVPEPNATDGSEVSALGSFDGNEVYRFTREVGRGCVCECVEATAGPVSNVRAVDGTLVVSFVAEDAAAVRETLRSLRSQFESVCLRRLVESAEGSDADPVVVDRNRLTDRQREVLETAHEMGYFDHPKGANAGEVAAELGISSSTLREHLASAQGKIMDALVGE